MVERINRFLKSSLRKIVDDLQSWDAHLSAIKYTINNFHPALRATPSKILLGYELRNHPDIELIRFLRKIAKTDLEVKADRDASRKLALEATNSLKKQQGLLR